MSTFYERLQSEEKELNERIEKLTSLLASEKAADLDPLQFNLLCIQESAMKTYGSVLSLRLATIKTEQQ